MKKYILPVMAMALAAAAQAQVTHNVVVERTNGEKTIFPASKVAGIEFKEMPEYTDAPNLLSAMYYTSDGLGVYEVSFGTDEPDEAGDPSTIGGVQVLMHLVGPKSEESIRAKLPAGIYRAGGSESFTFSPEHSGCWARVAEGSEGVTELPVVGGSVDVRHTQEGYDIRLEIVTIDGTEFDLAYEGPITFSLGSSEYEPITEDVNLTMDGLQARFYGNWFYPFADDAVVQAYTGSFDSSGTQTEGYWLDISVYMPKCENPMSPDVRLADGEYSIETRSMPRNNTYLPFTYSQGGLIEFMGMEYPSGTYIVYTGVDGTKKIGYISSGTLTISGGGSSMTLVGETEQGVKVNCTFNGNPVIRNFCNNDKSEPARPWSTIEHDVNLSFIPATVGFFYQDDEIVDGLTTWNMQIQDPEAKTGDYMMMTMLGPSVFADGTYTIGTSFESMTAFPGWTVFGGNMIHTWYGDLASQDAQGYSTDFMCITSGTITVTTIDAATHTRKVTFDLSTDNGHKVTGEYNGVLVDITGQLGPDQAPAGKKAFKARPLRK